MRGLSFLLFLCFVTSSLAQEDRAHPVINAWLEFGTYRISPVKKDRSAGVNINLKCQVNRAMATLQYMDCYDSEVAHGYFDFFTHDNHYHAGNMLIGITNRKCNFGHVSLSSGIGVFWGTFENLTIERFATLGFPFEAAASVNIFPFGGINMKAFANLNSRHSFIGFGMDLQLGKMREVKWSNKVFF